MTFIVITFSLVLFLVYAGYLLSKIGDGTLWVPWRLKWYVLPLIWLLFLLLPWAGQSLMHYAMGFAGASPDQLLGSKHIPFIRLLLLSPLMETVSLGGLYAISRVIPRRLRPDMIYVVASGVLFIFMHKAPSPLYWTWYFVGFATQAWLFSFLVARAGHLKSWLVISVGHGLANIGVLCAVVTTAALRAMA